MEIIFKHKLLCLGDNKINFSANISETNLAIPDYNSEIRALETKLVD
jgi:hypothetical protein